MARQRSTQKFSGTMGDVTYYKWNGKYYSRKKSTLSKEDVLTKKAFANSRKASVQFGKTSTANRLIRSSLMGSIPFTRKTEIHNKLQPQIRKLIMEAASSKEKTFRLNHLPWQQLTNFEFNKHTSLGNLATGFAQPKVNIDKASGNTTIQINNCEPLKEIVSLGPQGLFQIFATAAQIDFDKGKFVNITASSGYLPAISKVPKDIKLNLPLKTPVIHPLFISIGIVCYENVNGDITDFLNTERLALRIIQVVPVSSPLKKKLAAKKKK